MNPIFFANPSEFREWLARNHETTDELWVGYYKKATGKPSMTWSESVDQAICFGWIDGLRKSVDEESYKIRFTPRKPKSHWSAVNIQKVEKLTAQGLMTPAGLKAFRKRDEKRSKQASYEQKNMKLAPEYEAKIKVNPSAWDFFDALAPSYKKATIHWVMSAKKEETRRRRLDILIQSSADGQKVPPLPLGKK